jgi:hypothetical protein
MKYESVDEEPLRRYTASYSRQYSGLTFNGLTHTSRTDILAKSLLNPNELELPTLHKDKIYIYNNLK